MNFDNAVQKKCTVLLPFTSNDLFFISAFPSNVLLMNLSRQLGDYDSFLIGYMGCTMDEVKTSMYLSQDHKTCVLKMLSLWRCKDGQDGVKTVGQLLSVLKDVLQRGPYKVLENLINGKCSRSIYINAR